MKLLAAAAAVTLAFAGAACAQTQQTAAPEQARTAVHNGPNVEAQRAAMARLSWMVGDWMGEAAVAGPHPLTVHQTEHVEPAMDGLLLVVRGHGYADPSRTGDPIFRAFGVISYDDARGLYELRVYNDGRAATAEARFLDETRFQWMMSFAPVLIRYTITFDERRWTEVGEMSRDNGATWTPLVTLNLTKAG
jgi:hypothetical protein